MLTEILQIPALKTASKKAITPAVTTLYLQFNLQLHYSEISLFREAVLRCIPNQQEQEIFSNETIDKEGKKKNKFVYPLVQFRVRNGFAVLWAMQQAVPLVEKFLQQYSKQFKWGKRPFALQVQQREKENNYTVKLFNAKLRLQPVIYRLYAYIPFSNVGSTKNYTWLKENRNLPDVQKTKKMEQLLTNHLCSFIHFSGGFIPKEKIKLTILDKKPLSKIFYNGIEYAAFDLRYTVNLNLPDYIGLGNNPSHGFGWQRLEKE